MRTSQETLRRLRRVAELEPEMTPIQLAERLALSHVTVRKYLRAWGLYVPRGVARERMEARP